MGQSFQDHQWLPKTMGNTKPYIQATVSLETWIATKWLPSGQHMRVGLVDTGNDTHRRRESAT